MGCFFAGGFCGIVAIASEFGGLAWLHLVLLCVLCLFSLLLLGLGLFVVWALVFVVVDLIVGLNVWMVDLGWLCVNSVDLVFLIYLLV